MFDSVLNASVKPHPAAILIRRQSGETAEYPTGRQREAAADLQQLKMLGWSECVIIVESRTGSRIPVSIEPTCNGTAALMKALAVTRPGRKPGESVRSHYMPDEWDKLPQSDRDYLMGKDAAPKGGKA